MKAIRKSEASFSHSIDVDFQKNKKLMITINALSFVLFVVFYIIFYNLLFLAGVFNSPDIYFIFKSFRTLQISGSIIFLAGLLGILLIHELIHGFFFYWFTGEKPVIGFKSIYAYAGSPGWFIKKNYFQIVTLSPLIIMTLTGFILLSYIPFPYSSMLFLLVTANAAGSIGDIWMSLLLLRQPEGTYVNDSGISATICY